MSKEPFIVQGIPEPLAAVPRHKDIGGLSRILLLSRTLDDRAPLHIAVHVVNHIVGDATSKGEHYAEMDVHDFDEINVVWGEEGVLSYRFQLGDEEHLVHSPATVVIPAGIRHRAEAIQGSGLFFCILLK